MSGGTSTSWPRMRAGWCCGPRRLVPMEGAIRVEGDCHSQGPGGEDAWALAGTAAKRAAPCRDPRLDVPDSAGGRRAPGQRRRRSGVCCAVEGIFAPGCAVGGNATNSGPGAGLCEDPVTFDAVGCLQGCPGAQQRVGRRAFDGGERRGGARGVDPAASDADLGRTGRARLVGGSTGRESARAPGLAEARRGLRTSRDRGSPWRGCWWGSPHVLVKAMEKEPSDSTHWKMAFLSR